MEELPLRVKKSPSFINIIFIVFLSVASSSLAVPLLKLVLNDGVAAAWVAALRMAAMVVIIWPSVIFNKTLRQNIVHISFKEMKNILLAGILLSGHFFTLAISVEYTSVFGSVAIFSTQYIFTIIIACLFLKEKPGRGVSIGIFMSIAGIIVISWSDFNLQGDITGSLFALISSFLFAAYYVTGRHVRKSVSIGAYTLWVNTVCAALLLIAAFIIKEPYKPLSAVNILVFFGLAVFGSLGGHMGINWALKYVTSDVTSIILLSQPVYAGMIGYLFFNEQVRVDMALGALFILSGIACYILIQRRTRRKAGGIAAKLVENE